MKTLEIYLNIFHYCIYKFDYKLHLLSNKINPFVLLGQIPSIKKRFEEQGSSLLEVTNNLWGNKRSGFSIMISNSTIVVVLSFLISGLTTTAASFFNYYFYVMPNHLIFHGIVSSIICYFAVFKGDKYLEYFNKFEKWSKAEKWKYCLLSFTFIISSVLLVLYSFRFMSKV